MSIALPVLVSSRFDQANGTIGVLPASPGTVNLVANQLYVFFYGSSRATLDLSSGFAFLHGATTRTSDWHYINQTAQFNTALRRLGAFWHIPSANETVAITFDPAGGSCSHHAMALITVPSGFNPAAPIVQSKGAILDVAGLSHSVALDNPPTEGNLELAAFYNANGTSAITHRTNWTELSDDQGTGTTADAGSLEVQYKAASLEATASASVAATNRTWGGLVLEIAALPPEVEDTPLSRRHVGRLIALDIL